jgi:hypothetical protein
MDFLVTKLFLLDDLLMQFFWLFCCWMGFLLEKLWLLSWAKFGLLLLQRLLRLLLLLLLLEQLLLLLLLLELLLQEMLSLSTLEVIVPDLVEYEHHNDENVPEHVLEVRVEDPEEYSHLEEDFKVELDLVI